MVDYSSEATTSSTMKITLLSLAFDDRVAKLLSKISPTRANSGQ